MPDRDDGLMNHVPVGWTVLGALPNSMEATEPLEISDTHGEFTLRVEWTNDAFLCDARIDGLNFVLRAEDPRTVREWVLATLDLVRKP